MTEHLPDHLPNREGEISERLDSWKEIAVYLRRSVRTVQRWESEAGLPVHRHPHGKVGSVWATKEEIDSWWTNRKPTAAGEGRLRWILWRAGVPALVAAGLLVWLAVSSRDTPPAVTLGDESWLLIADFASESADPWLGPALSGLLEQELESSAAINVAPPERMLDVLDPGALSRTSPIDLASALEVARLDSQIEAILTGSIQAAGDGLLLQAEIRAATDGTAIASFEELADSADGLPVVVRNLALWARSTLGEPPGAAEAEEDLHPRVTSSSLQAAGLFRLANRQAATGEVAVAEQLLREAIHLDPEFALANTFLAWMLVNQGRPPDQFLPAAERGVELAEGKTPRIRLFTQGSLHHMKGEWAEAEAAYRALLALHPNDYWANNNLWVVYHQMGRPRLAVPFTVRVAELRPLSFTANQEAAMDLAFVDADPEAARPFVDRARALVTAAEIRDAPFGVAWVETFDFMEELSSGQATVASARLDRVRSEWDGDPVRRELLGALAPLYGSLGRFAEAERLVVETAPPGAREERLAALAYLREDDESMRRHLDALLATGNPRIFYAPSLLVRSGRLEQAEQLLGAEGRVPEHYGDVARGEIAAARGRVREADELLSRGLLLLDEAPSMTHLLALETLARVRGSAAGPSAAIETLQRIRPVRERAFFQPVIVPFWLRLEEQLARYLRAAGRAAEAEAIGDRLRELLAAADPGHPILHRFDQPGSP